MKNFISFEGGEGSGKSTQSKLLQKSILKISKKVLLTREPGGTKSSEKIRNLIVKKNNHFEPLTELLLINAARNEHIKNMIIPNLKSNKIVICDRFVDSTYAYQVMGQKLNKKYFDLLNNIIVKKIIPEHTFLIKLNPQIGLKRSLARRNNEVKYEYFDLEFHKKVLDAYLKIAKSNSRVFIVDGSKNIKSIHKTIVDFLNSKSFLKENIPYSYD